MNVKLTISSIYHGCRDDRSKSERCTEQEVELLDLVRATYVVEDPGSLRAA